MFRNTAALCALLFTATLTAHADFSYTRTQKVTGGSMGAMAGAQMNRSARCFFKGKKSAEVDGAMTVVIDFAAETITTIDNTQKTYRVRNFGGSAAAGLNAEVKADVKPTGEVKVLSGFNASETVVSMDMDGGAPTKMHMEVSLWTSTDVPGSAEMHDFYRKNVAGVVYAAMAGSSGHGLQTEIAKLHSKLAQIDGTPLEMVIRIKAPAGIRIPQVTPEQMAEFRTAMEARAKQGGAQSAAMQQAIASLARGVAAPGASGSGQPFIELTIDNTGFSTDPVPDSVFVVPSHYKPVQ